MFLKKLVAYGFKSFAEKLEIDFDGGVTAIVGPNGSGKSNITDAIRWVLGEQNLRMLRGTRAEDIIFNGSLLKKPLNMAEVTLIFDNEKKLLPLDFAEISITRRLFRSGESEYFINNVKSRLKDIHTLFADTGIGKNSMAVISQNKVDEVLNTKPEERRYFFEECAGITKFRERKKVSIKKLEDTENNILRLKDIFTEVESRVVPLKKEAEKTKRYNEIKKDYIDLKLTNIFHIYEELKKEENSLIEEKKSFEEEELYFKANINITDTKKLQIQVDIKNLEDKLKTITSEIDYVKEEQEYHTNEKTKLVERIAQNNIQRDNFIDSIRNLKEEFNIISCDYDAILRKKSLIKEVNEKLKNEFLNLKNKEKEQGIILADLEEKLAKEVASEEKNQRDINSLQEEILKEQTNLSDIDATIKALNENRENIIKEEITKKSELELIKGKTIEINNQKEKSIANIQVKRENLEDLIQKSKVIKDEAEALSIKLKALEEKNKIYEKMQESYEGFSKSVKEILRSKEDFRQGICGAVGELISSDDKYVDAINASLGNSMQNIVCIDADVAKSAINFLKRRKLGRVTFMPLNTIQGQNVKNDFEVGKFGFISYMDKVVKVDKQYEIVINNLLGRIVLVDNIDNALLMAKAYNYKLRIVTLNGEIIHPFGSISGGGKEKQDSGYLGRNLKIKENKEKIKVLRDSLKIKREKDIDLEEKISILKTHINEIEVILQSLNIKIKEKEIEKNHILKWLETEEERKKGIINQIKSFEIKKLALDNTILNLNKEISIKKSHLQNKNDKKLKLKDEIKLANEELKNAITLSNKREISYNESKQEIIHIEEKLNILEKQREVHTKNILDYENKLLSIEKIITDSKIAFKENDSKIKELLGKLNTLQKDKDKYYLSLLDKRNSIDDFDKDKLKNMENSNKIRNKIHKLELNLTKITTEIKNLETNLKEEFDLSIEDCEKRRILGEIKDIEEDLKKLDKEMKNMGKINPNAIDEYEEINNRYEFLQKQIEDLTSAKEDLNQLIIQIDETMENTFKNAFSKIKILFNDIFQKLFGGGEAKLILNNEKEILASGIEIMVTPPGKKNLNLAVLSGGERTLTVIALLFAFFSYNPAPFSVLDEIDAPLDEANVKRFAQFLKEYGKSTQFIIVTHRKGTMEVANSLYGVTVEEMGSSKLISVKLDEA